MIADRTQRPDFTKDERAGYRRGGGFCSSKSSLIKEMIMDTPVILITGGLTGIGRAAAIAFAKKGAKVVVAGRRDEAASSSSTSRALRGQRPGSSAQTSARIDDVRALVDKTVARSGRLDVAVNNAGNEGPGYPDHRADRGKLCRDFDMNILGVILSMKHEVRVMQGQGSGSIINISSTHGHEGVAGTSVHVGSKEAVEGIIKSVARRAPSSRPAVSTATAHCHAAGSTTCRSVRSAFWDSDEGAPTIIQTKRS